MSESPLSYALLEALPAEIHEQIFNYVVSPGPSVIFKPANLLVSKLYYSRAARSYYQRGDIALSGTRSGLACFQSIPTDLKNLITSMAFTSGKKQLQVLAVVVAECPRLVNLRLEDILPQFTQRRMIFHFEKWWDIISHIPNLTIPESQPQLRLFIQIKRILREHPTWKMAQWGEIGTELDLWDEVLSGDAIDQVIPYLEVLQKMYLHEITTAGGNTCAPISLVRLERFRSGAEEAIQITKLLVEMREMMRGGISIGPLVTRAYNVRDGEDLCGDRGWLSFCGGVRVNGTWTFPGH